jgi:hypothetical protein
MWTINLLVTSGVTHVLKGKDWPTVERILDRFWDCTAVVQTEIIPPN